MAASIENSADSQDIPEKNNADATQLTVRTKIKKKKKIPGIVYLSYIPPRMSVKKAREIFSEFGEVGRIFFQPEKSKNPRKPSKKFTEGWVEFLDKKVAKYMATVLNGRQVGGKRRAAYYDSLWSLKYLHRFRWGHLNEKLVYEKAVREQRLRTEIAQAKREANFYVSAVEKSKRLKRMAKEGTEEVEVVGKGGYVVNQRLTDEEIRRKRKNPHTNVRDGPDLDLLKSIFVQGGDDSDS